eukprot:scaffold1.g5412.t1
MRGPLDRWLIRPAAPQQDVDEDLESDSGAEDEQEQQEEQDPQEQERNRPSQPKPCSLEVLLTPRDATQDASTSAVEQMQIYERGGRARWQADWEATGRMHPRLAARLSSTHVARYSQRCLRQTHPWQQPVLDARGGGNSVPPEQAGALTVVRFDSQGELLVTGSEEGLITVHSAADLAAAGGGRGAAPPSPAAEQQPAPAQPLLALDTGLAKLQALEWNPCDENMVAAASSASRQLLLYDLQHTQGRPAQVLVAPQASSAALAGATAVGVSSLAFFRSSSYLVAAGGLGGQVLLWDRRAAKPAPVSVLQSQQSSAVYALAVSPDEQVVLAGTQGGDVKAWDLRGGSGSALRFGAVGLHHHPPLGAVGLRGALAGVPGLLEQTGIPASAVQSMQLDPCDPRRLGFHLGCGWSGVLDLVSQAVTHVHAPAHAFADEGQLGGADATAAQLLPWSATAAPALHRRACWTANGGRFCVPSRRDDSLLLLDFFPSSAAGCWALGGDRATESGGWPGQAPSAARVALTQAAVCVAAHPTSNLLVAGSLASYMSVVQLP